MWLQFHLIISLLSLLFLSLATAKNNDEEDYEDAGKKTSTEANATLTTTSSSGLTEEMKKAVAACKCKEYWINYQPVCGENGKEYQSKCIAECLNQVRISRYLF